MELVLNDENNCAVDAEATLMSAYNDDILLAALEVNQQNAKFAMAIEVTYTTDKEDDRLFQTLGESITESEATIATYRAGNPRGVSSESLSKLWGISENDAVRILQQNTQRDK